MYAVILTIPRVAALRPAAAPAIIKSIFNSHDLSSKILDLNIDYFTAFKDKRDVFQSGYNIYIYIYIICRYNRAACMLGVSFKTNMKQTQFNTL